MAAGLGFKTFTTGEVLTSADVNGYLMQGILVFATEAARNSAITAPQEGQFAFTKDTNSLWYYTGSAWVASGATGDIEGVTAGVGISGGGTSGTVTITNSMATEITAKADLIVGTGNAAFDNLPVGANGTVLTADSTVSPTGLKWAAPAVGAGLTLVKSQVIGSAVSSVTVTSAFSATYDAYVIYLTGGTGSVDDQDITLQLGSTTTGYYAAYIGAVISTAASTIAANNNTSNFTRAGNVITDGPQVSFEIINPNLAKRTYIKNGTYGGDTQVRYWAGYVDNTTQYTAFTLAPASGTLTGGTIFVYGYALS